MISKEQTKTEGSKDQNINEGDGTQQDESKVQLLNEVKHLKEIINLKNTIINDLQKN